MANFRYRLVLFPFAEEYDEDQDLEKLGKNIGEYLLEFVKNCKRIDPDKPYNRHYYHTTIERCYENVEELAEQFFPYVEDLDEFNDRLEELYNIADTHIKAREGVMASRFAWVEYQPMGVGTAELERVAIDNAFDYLTWRNGYESEKLKPYKEMINR